MSAALPSGFLCRLRRYSLTENGTYYDALVVRNTSVRAWSRRCSKPSERHFEKKPVIHVSMIHRPTILSVCEAGLSFGPPHSTPHGPARRDARAPNHSAIHADRYVSSKRYSIVQCAFECRLNPKKSYMCIKSLTHTNPLPFDFFIAFMAAWIDILTITKKRQDVGMRQIVSVQ